MYLNCINKEVMIKMYFKIEKFLKSASGILKILFFVICGINKRYE